MKPIFKIENMDLFYGEKQALKNINIEISEKRSLLLLDLLGVVSQRFYEV